MVFRLTDKTTTGPNGPLPQEILDMYPDAPLIQRQGEVNAWDNAEFRDAIKATNKSQVIMAGIVTDVCESIPSPLAPAGDPPVTKTHSLPREPKGTTFLALSLRDEGYSVWANVEASGTTTPLIRDVSNDRMARAGVQIVSLFSIVCDLMRDWRNTPGAAELFPWLDKYLPAYGMVARGHKAAIENGTVIPGEASLPS